MSAKILDHTTQPARPLADRLVTIVLMTCTFTTAMTISILSPLLVEMARTFDTTVAIMGQVVTASTLPWAMAAVFIGPLSDRYGRRPILGLSLATLTLANLLSGLAWDYTSLLVFRLMAGTASAGIGPVSVSAAADHFRPEERGKALGWVLTGFSLATLLGTPGIALIAQFLGWRLSFTAFGIFTAAVALASWLTVRSSAHLTRTPISYLDSLKKAVNNQSFRLIIVSNVLTQAGYFVIMVYLPAFLIQNYNLSVGQTAPFLVVMAAGMVMGTFGGGHLADRMVKTKLCFFGLTLASIVCLPLMLPWGTLASSGIAALYGMAHGFTRSPSATIVTGLSETSRGTFMGINATSNQLGHALGTAAGGIILSFVGYPLLGVLGFVFLLPAAFVYRFLRIRA
ncbi:MAG: MFS transporter [Chloroflexi bacterium]|nr:MFS transporter [Chloroflexota bacterium]